MISTGLIGLQTFDMRVFTPERDGLRMAFLGLLAGNP
jgi:hypothetical protein